MPEEEITFSLLVDAYSLRDIRFKIGTTIYELRGIIDTIMHESGESIDTAEIIFAQLNKLGYFKVFDIPELATITVTMSKLYLREVLINTRPIYIFDLTPLGRPKQRIVLPYKINSSVSLRELIQFIIDGMDGQANPISTFGAMFLIEEMITNGNISIDGINRFKIVNKFVFTYFGMRQEFRMPVVIPPPEVVQYAAVLRWRAPGGVSTPPRKKYRYVYEWIVFYTGKRDEKIEDILRCLIDESLSLHAYPIVDEILRWKGEENPGPVDFNIREGEIVFDIAEAIGVKYESGTYFLIQIEPEVAEPIIKISGKLSEEVIKRCGGTIL